MSDSVRSHRRQPTRLPRPWDSPGKNIGVGCHFFLQCMKVKSESEVALSCLTLRDPMHCSLPGSSIHGVFQARVLEWDAIAFSVLLQQKAQLYNPFKLYFSYHLANWVYKIHMGRSMKPCEETLPYYEDWALLLIMYSIITFIIHSQWNITFL